MTAEMKDNGVHSVLNMRGITCVAYDLCVLQGADVVLCDKEGKTALHWTANNANATTATAILVSWFTKISPVCVVSSGGTENATLSSVCCGVGVQCRYGHESSV